MHWCGHKIADESLHYSTRGGVFLANYCCYKCQRKRFWKSFVSSFTQLTTAATFASRINIAKILNFFMLIQCAFPTSRSIYYAAQHVVRPLIYCFYNNERQNNLNERNNFGNHYIMNGQYDSPGYCVNNSTVSAMESITKK